MGRRASVNPGREQALGEGLLVGRSLVDLRSSLLPVRVMNLSNKPRKLPKGTFIGLCEPVISVSEVEETPYYGTGKHEEYHSDGRLSDHLQERSQELIQHWMLWRVLPGSRHWI